MVSGHSSFGFTFCLVGRFGCYVTLGVEFVAFLLFRGYSIVGFLFSPGLFCVSSFFGRNFDALQ